MCEEKSTGIKKRKKKERAFFFLIDIQQLALAVLKPSGMLKREKRGETEREEEEEKERGRKREKRKNGSR